MSPDLVGVWRRTDKWEPAHKGTGSGGFGVESVETGQIGFCKQRGIANEKICSDLAGLVGVNVPESRLGTVEGSTGTMAISIVHFKEVTDLGRLREKSPDLFRSAEVQHAVQNASGLLAFHAWVNTADLKDDHLVFGDDGGGDLRVAAIDFESSLSWADANTPVTAPNGPAAMVNAVSKPAVEAAVVGIEACPVDAIERIVNAIPDELLPAPDKTRIIEGLKARRPRVRGPMQQKGWL